MAPSTTQRVAAVVVVVALAVAGANAYCWYNQRLAISARSTYTYYFSDCYTADYFCVGNYSVRTVSNDWYTMRFGDQLCGTTATDNTYYDYYGYSYTDPYTNTFEWQQYLGYKYPTTFPKTQVVCDDTFTGCQIEGDICMTVWYMKNGTAVLVEDDAACKPMMVYAEYNPAIKDTTPPARELTH